MNIEKSLTYDKLIEKQKVLSHCVIANPSVCKTTDYDKLMSDLLASDKSEEYKRSILSLLSTDYSKYHDGNMFKKYEMLRYKTTLAVRLNETRYEEFTTGSLWVLARNLRIENYKTMCKEDLIKKIDSIKKYFCNKNKK